MPAAGVLQRDEETSQQGVEFKNEMKNSLSAELVTIAKKHFGGWYGWSWQSTIDTYVDGVLNDLIRTYGLKNQKPIRLKIRQLAGTLGNNTARLLDEITTAIGQLPATMNTPKNKGIVKLALYPEAKSDFGSFVEEYISDNAINFAAARIQTMIASLKNVEKRILGDWDGLKQQFSLTGKVKVIELTGSDFHNEGQQVAIITSDTDSRLVYKPRTTSPDKELIGEDGFFQSLNEISLNTVNLPTMKFREMTDESGKSYSYVEYQKKEALKTEEQIESYYVRYGQLAVASKLAGVNDLHHENVMSVSGGPTIIDAETSFLPYVLTSVDFAKTGIKDALTSFRDDEGLVNTSFYTMKEKTDWDSSAQLRLKYSNTFDQYVDAIRREDLKGEGNYLFSFKLGIQNMLNLIDKKRDQIVEAMMQRIVRVRDIRVVPFDTKQFTVAIASYHNLLEVDRPQDAESQVTDCVGTIKNALLQKGFSPLSEAFLATTKSTVGKGLLTDFQRRDTPILHFDPRKNTLTYHGSHIAMSKEWADPRATIKKAVYSVGDSDIQKVTSDLLA